MYHVQLWSQRLPVDMLNRRRMHESLRAKENCPQQDIDLLAALIIIAHHPTPFGVHHLD